VPADPDGDPAVVREIGRDVTARMGELALATLQRFGHLQAQEVVGMWEARTGQSLLLAAALGLGLAVGPSPQTGLVQSGGRASGVEGRGDGDGSSSSSAAAPPRRDALRDTLLSFLG
jgi:hypothetical protein